MATTFCSKNLLVQYLWVKVWSSVSLHVVGRLPCLYNFLWPNFETSAVAYCFLCCSDSRRFMCFSISVVLSAERKPSIFWSPSFLSFWLSSLFILLLCHFNNQWWQSYITKLLVLLHNRVLWDSQITIALTSPSRKKKHFLCESWMGYWFQSMYLFPAKSRCILSDTFRKVILQFDTIR